MGLTVGLISSHLLISLQIVLHFALSLLWLFNLVTSVTRISPSCCHPCSYLLIRNDNDLHFMCTFYFLYIDKYFLHYLLSLNRVNDKSVDGTFDCLHWVFLANWLIPTPEPFCSLDWNHSIRALVSNWPRVQQLSIKLVELVSFHQFNLI